MNALLWILGAIVANTLVGATVWASIDDKDQRLFKWYESCQPETAWLMQPLVLNAWPVGLWLWWVDRNKA